MEFNTYIRLSESDHCGNHGHLYWIREWWKCLHVESEVDLGLCLQQRNVVLQSLCNEAWVVNDANHGMIVHLLFES